eukprot:gb/GEZJ01000340.1/.p1 GENE.gb/GEZJ01000340.1/~~gb/GEZJ01000340.1/.p1  ORF type:complete len:431 (-),score=61.60 gb/GEZJ01000340.1/:2509-3801(-)
MTASEAVRGAPAANFVARDQHDGAHGAAAGEEPRRARRRRARRAATLPRVMLGGAAAAAAGSRNKTAAHPAHPAHPAYHVSAAAAPHAVHPHHPAAVAAAAAAAQRRRRHRSLLSASSSSSSSSLPPLSSSSLSSPPSPPSPPHKYSQVVRARVAPHAAMRTPGSSVRPTWGYTHSSRALSAGAGAASAREWSASSAAATRRARSTHGVSREVHGAAKGEGDADADADRDGDGELRRPRGYPKPLGRGNGLPVLSARFVSATGERFVLDTQSRRRTMVRDAATGARCVELVRSRVSLHERATLRCNGLTLGCVSTEMLSARRATRVMHAASGRALLVLRFARATGDDLEAIATRRGAHAPQQVLRLRRARHNDDALTCWSARTAREVFAVGARRTDGSRVLSVRGGGYDGALCALLALSAAHLLALAWAS